MSNKNRGRKDAENAPAQNTEEVNTTPQGTNEVPDTTDGGEPEKTEGAEPEKQPVNTIKQSEIADGIPTVELMNVKIHGVELRGTINIHGEEKTVRIPKTSQKKVLATIPGVGQVIITVKKIKSNPGRPADPTSKRQAELADKAERHAYAKEHGIEIKPGRPPLEGSKRQETLAVRAEKMGALVEAKRQELGEDHPDYKLGAAELIVKYNIQLPKGRQAGEDSDAGEIKARRELKMATMVMQKRAELGEDHPDYMLEDDKLIEKYDIQLPKGRPKEKDDDVVVAGLIEVEE
jgi:hypothetical protein